MVEWSPVGQVPWRMTFHEDAALERRKLERRPRWWMLWTVTVAGAVSWPVAFVVVGG